MDEVSVVLNTLPVIEGNTQMYFTVISSADNSLNLATITDSFVLYGNVNLITDSVFSCKDNDPVAIGVSATYDGNTYFTILYTKAVVGQVLPNNTQRLIQKVPLGIFNSFNSDTIQYQLFNSIGKMINDYYNSYFTTQNNCFSSTYSNSSEFEYNGTSGLLSNSTSPDKLIQLLAALDIVSLNTYDLELFISKYIYYRLGISCPVYINDHVLPPGSYWILGVSALGINTELAPAGYLPVITTLEWVIYNSSSFTPEFQNEITQLIIRVSRADISNIVTFNSIVDPTTDGFTLIGATYLLDPRLLYDKCLSYSGDGDFPLNVIGYKKNF